MTHTPLCLTINWNKLEKHWFQIEHKASFLKFQPVILSIDSFYDKVLESYIEIYNEYEK